jgi:hypothetical protein
MGQLGFKEIDYIERIIPELVWIRYLILALGEYDGIRTTLRLIKECASLKQWEGGCRFCLQSNYRRLTVKDWTELRASLGRIEIAARCQNALAPFIRCYPSDNPFANLFGNKTFEPPSTEDIELARKVVSSLFDRRAKEASAVQSVFLVAELDAGTLKYTSAVRPPDLNAIFGDFDSESAQHACSHIRIQTNFMYASSEKEIGDTWARYFWNRGKELVPVSPEIAIPSQTYDADAHPLLKFAIDYEKYAWGIVREIWSKLPVDIYADECFSVLGALLARQCNLTTTLASNYFLWDFHAGPLFLRPMTDCYITAAWILKDPDDRARKFILHGLGQEKLRIEHYKSILGEHDEEDRKRFEEVIEVRERWLNSQHFSFLQHVDIGSWSGISTRKMAEQADCLSLYNFAYTPWSFAAHGTWNHIGCYNAVPSREPLHKYIWQPFNGDHGRHVDVIINATKYFDKLCVLLTQTFKLEMSVPTPNRWLHDRLDQLSKEMPRDDSVEEGESTLR